MQCNQERRVDSGADMTLNSVNAYKQERAGTPVPERNGCHAMIEHPVSSDTGRHTRSPAMFRVRSDSANSVGPAIDPRKPSTPVVSARFNGRTDAS